ncbi:hypothetical protein ALC53_00577, partial [Atta colombica]
QSFFENILLVNSQSILPSRRCVVSLTFTISYVLSDVHKLDEITKGTFVLKYFRQSFRQPRTEGAYFLNVIIENLLLLFFFETVQYTRGCLNRRCTIIEYIYQKVSGTCQFCRQNFNLNSKTQFPNISKTCCVLKMSEGQAWTLKIVRARQRR